jgi:signal transduction histidine kinase
MKIDVSAENKFVLIITDDGTAFNPNNGTRKGRGITNVKSRAALVEAEIFWQTGENGGTIFQLNKKLN